MQAVIAILAALVQRAATGEGAYLDVSVADGVRRADVAVRRRVLRDRRDPRARATTSSPVGTRVTTSTGAPTTAGSRSARSSRTSTPTCAAPSAASSGSRTRPTTPRRTRSAPTSRAAIATRTRDEWVAQLGPADTCVSEVATVPELVHDAHFRARHVFVEATAAEHGDVRTGRLGARRHGSRPTRPGRARRDRHRHRRAAAARSATRPRRSRPYEKKESRHDRS